MKAIALLVALSSVVTELAAQVQLAGEWRGHWFRAGDSVAVTMRVQRNSAKNAYTATFDSDRLRVTAIPFAEVALQGCCAVTMQLQGDQTRLVFSGTLRGNTLAGEFREGQSEGRFAYTRALASSAALSEREIAFRNGDVKLAGTLILPAGGNTHAAVVFVHGSGAEGRWASRYLATTFARHGVAALIYDKRGVGQSTGDWRSATLDDLAGDAAAAVAHLRNEPRIDARRIGIHGHSQGGTLAPMIAVRAQNVAFVIASAAAGVPTDSTEIFSILNSVYPSAASATDSANARAYTAELVAAAYHGKPRSRLDSLVLQYQGRPWFFAPPAPDASYWSFSRIFAQYHPLDWWRRVRVPVLLIYGAEDQRVPPAESAARITAEIVRHTPEADVTVRIMPGADHTFRLPPGPGGWPDTAPDYLTALLNWLSARR